MNTQKQTPYTVQQIEAAISSAPIGGNDPKTSYENMKHREALKRMLAKARGEA